MTNHSHVIAVPQTESSLAAAFRDTHSIYGQWFNKKYGLSGHLWQNRFYSCVLGESHLWAAVKYVERNPVRAGLVTRAEDYPWSSAHAHAYGDHDPLLHEGLPFVGVVGSWAEWLAAEDLAAQLDAIRKSTARDLPFADDVFIDHLEQQLGYTLRPQKAGRKPKGNRSHAKPDLEFE
jgi:putative transposase